MTDTVDKQTRSQIMAKVKSKGTKPELYVRRTLHACGFRYRLHRDDLPGKPDLVLPSFTLVIFVHGCFWHWHGCKRSRMPSSNVEYWEKKIQRNVQRDQKNQAALTDLGWEWRIVWECELEESTRRLIDELEEKRS